MASRFWVGGTGTWDASDTTHWAASSGGAGGQSVPGSSDTVTLDASSGGGTVTVNTNFNIVSLTGGAFTGTLDFSANNNNVTYNGTVGFIFSGSGTRTLNLGDGTHTISGAQGSWSVLTTTNLTLNANSSTISFSGTPSATQTRTFAGGGKTFNIVTIGGGAGIGATTISGSNTFATLNITAPNYVLFVNGTTQTISSAAGLNWSGSSGSESLIRSAVETVANISIASGTPTMSWVALREMAFAGGAAFTATSSFDLGGNTGITITAPSSSGGFPVLGGPFT